MTQAGVKAGNEPTMEDILASIRRIIAEDYSAQAALQGQPVPAAFAQPAVQTAPQSPALPVMPQASTDILDLNSRGERFTPPMPEVVPVPTPQAAAPQMPRASMPNLQVAQPAPAMSVQAESPMQSETQGFAARAVSEFSERLGRSFAAAERYQREAQTAPQQEPQAPSQPVLAREPITQSAVQAVAAAVQSHLAEAQALQSAQPVQAGNAALARAPEPVRLVEPKPAPRPATPAQPVAQQPVAPAPVAASAPLSRPVLSPQKPVVEQRPVETPAPVAAQPVAAPQPQRPVEPVMQNDPPPAWLLSPKTGSSISGSFKALQEKQAPAPVQLSDVQSAALQELVAAALRPMLKDWLDQHLPGMVERMITAEIQRVTRGE